MTIKLYDFPSSPNCKRVKVVLEEKKLAYDKVFIDLPKREQKRPEYLKLNPYGKVPVIADGDRVLYESCIINEYLEETYPDPPLMPKNPHKRGRIRILIDYGINHFGEPYQKVRKEMGKDIKDQDQSVIEEGKKTLKELIQPFEDEIGDQEYLAGAFSLLDADLIPRFVRYEEWGLIPDPSFPKLGQWLKRMKERPSVRVIL
jgi:glutathione S-transferase